ncbi:HBR001Wp [Eremothecium sinecaudum]|uniref:Adenylyl-sulfate kinase n=1 Tax=Eremothecium sinecaudum TaxID=45286 RepID=A0A120K112_9SACH|nr:HBR001Wp [Eremothecium sinecaudum]AMD18902.1 HBR001Wp [Eremothecium sinecaudum]
MSTNIFWHSQLTRNDREKLRYQRGCTVWLTGLSASGKSTIACALEEILLRDGLAAYRLDGDNIRLGLNKDLGFSREDRRENIRRIAEVSKLFADSCAVSIASAISPFKIDRYEARKIHEVAELPFIEVFVDVPIKIAEQRDPKGLYKKARDGIIPDFTGISSPYERPDSPEIHLRTEKQSVEQCAKLIYTYLRQNNLL